MTKVQEDYLNMVLTVIAVMDNNNKIWQNNAVLKKVVNALRANADDVVDLQSRQDADDTGIAADKKKKRGLLEQDNIGIGSILSFFASDTDNTDLQHKMNFTPSGLGKMQALKLIGLSDIVQSSGTKYLADALEYGLTQEMLTAQVTHKTDFSNLLSSPRVAQTEVSQATEKIADIMESMHGLIDDKFDKGVMLYRGTDFYIQVQKARIIIDSATHHLALTTLITDGNGNPLPDVKISIVNGGDKVLRNSSPLGNTRVQNLLAGDHILTAEKPGFEKVELPFLVSEPETTRLTVVMKVL